MAADEAQRETVKKIFKKCWPIAAILLCLPFFASGQQTSLPSFPEATTFAPGDILWLVINPATTQNSRKIQAQNLLKRRHPCEVAFGNPDPTGQVFLTVGTDAPGTCANVTGATAVITAVACRADTGGTNVYPILSGGSTTSIVNAPFTCGIGVCACGAI